MPDLISEWKGGVAEFNIPGITAGITTKSFMRMTSNRSGHEFNSALLERTGAENYFRMSPRLGDDIVVVEPGKTEQFPIVDAMLYFKGSKGPICLLGPTADTPVVVMAAPGAQAYGIIHSGRRGGTEKNISGRVISLLRDTGVMPDEIFAAIWPGICPACSPLTERQMEALRGFFPEEEDHPSLTAIIRNQLLAEGIVPEKIFTDSSVCSRHTTDNPNGWVFASMVRDFPCVNLKDRDTVFINV